MSKQVIIWPTLQRCCFTYTTQVRVFLKLQIFPPHPIHVGMSGLPWILHVQKLMVKVNFVQGKQAKWSAASCYLHLWLCIFLFCVTEKKQFYPWCPKHQYRMSRAVHQTWHPKCIIANRQLQCFISNHITSWPGEHGYWLSIAEEVLSKLCELLYI